MRIVYFEPFSGISGDMMLGALLDLGFGLQELQRKLALLGIPGVRVSAESTSRAGIRATRFRLADAEGGAVNAGHGHNHRTFREIRETIESSGLSSWVKGKSVETFRRLAEAEAKIHNQPVEEVHFHEVGALDSIVDIVGSMIALEPLVPARFLSAPVNLGQGTLTCRHGVYPAPGPATQELLRGTPAYSDSMVGELTTPTGAALLTALVEAFCMRPLMKAESIGYGAGSRDPEGHANVLRITVGEEAGVAGARVSAEDVAVIEATIDDMNPQNYGYFQEKAFGAGALDVYLTPVQMKKNRPGIHLTVVCGVWDSERLSKLIFAETTTIGVRIGTARRRTLEREVTRVDTPYGTVSVKVSSLGGERLNFAPEYEDCRRLAKEKNVPLKDVQSAAVRAYLQRLNP